MTYGFPHDEDKRREREAANWCMRMHGDDAASHRASFEEWLKTDPRNLEAYNEVEESYILSGAPARRRIDRRETGMPVKDDRKRRWMLGAGLVGAAAAIGILLVSIDQVPRTVPFSTTDVAQDSHGITTRTFRTTAARLERITLDDGSVVVLAAASELTSVFDMKRRLLTLSRGGGRFEVAHERRPFIVFAGGGSVTARGTIFEVRLRGDRTVEVDLVRGAVDVAAPPNGTGQPDSPAVRRLRPGDRVVFKPKVVARADDRRLEEADGAVAGANHPLTVGDLVTRINAAYPAEPQLVVEDEEVLRSAVGGTFRLRDPQTMAEWLGTMFGMTLDRSKRNLIVLRPQAAPG